MKAALSTLVAFAALAVCVAAPTALAEGRLAGSLEPDGVAYFKANELATAASSSLAPAAAVDYFRANERQAPTSEVITSLQTGTPSASTGPTVDWTPIVIGIGLGAIALGLGILLTRRFRPNRQLAH